MKLVVIDNRCNRDLIEKIKSFSDVVVVESSLYSLQVEHLDKHISKVDHVVIIDMALRYDNVRDFLGSHNMPLLEIHSKEDYLSADYIVYPLKFVEVIASFDAIVDRIKGL